MRKRKIINKKYTKKQAGQCRICGENNYSTLSVHRIVPGSKYSKEAVTVLCENCHRKVHNKEIEIDRWYNSTKGRVLRIIINEEEKFV